MKRRKRLSSWLRQLRRRRAAKKQHTPLREFVYLDEVSVYSLIASRLGPVAVEFTDTETASLQSELSGTLGANAGIAKSELSSRLQANQTQGSQVLRRSIVQTTFRDLYEFEKDHLILRPIVSGESVPRLASFERLQSWLPSADRPWVISSDELVRGELLELEVEVEVEPIFGFSTAVSTLLEIIRETPEFAEMTNLEQLGHAQSMGRVLEKLLAGLIPLRARISDYRVIEINGKKYLVHRDILSQVQLPEDLEAYAINLVGVAEEALFWKDIRRVLFARSQYRVLCRIARSGIQESWTPVKLANVFNEVSPTVASSLEEFNRSAASLPQAIDAGERTRQEYQEAFRKAHVDYALAILARHGHTITRDEILQDSSIINAIGTANEDIEERRETFNEITRLLQDRFDFTADPVEAASLRSVSLLDAGIGIDGRLMTASPSVPTLTPREEERFLDVEIVAIYW